MIVERYPKARNPATGETIRGKEGSVFLGGDRREERRWAKDQATLGVTGILDDSPFRYSYI